MARCFCASPLDFLSYRIISRPIAGSKLAAGWLIERCGWKGKQLGPVGVYEQQALVLVNGGGARGEDVLRLANAIQQSVQAMFGVTLEPEPVML